MEAAVARKNSVKKAGSRIIAKPRGKAAAYGRIMRLPTTGLGIASTALLWLCFGGQKSDGTSGPAPEADLRMPSNAKVHHQRIGRPKLTSWKPLAIVLRTSGFASLANACKVSLNAAYCDAPAARSSAGSCAAQRRLSSVSWRAARWRKQPKNSVGSAGSKSGPTCEQAGLGSVGYRDIQQQLCPWLQTRMHLHSCTNWAATANITCHEPP